MRLTAKSCAFLSAPGAACYNAGMEHPQPIAVTLYTRPGCHLCEDVAEQLESLAARWPLRISALNILDNLDLHRRFWDKIPVVEIGGETLQAPIQPARLAAAVARAGGKQ